MQYKITKVYKRYMNCYVEADSPEEALKASAANDAEWEWDNSDGRDSYVFHSGGWELLDDEDEIIEDGDFTDDQVRTIAGFVGNITGW